MIMKFCDFERPNGSWQHLHCIHMYSSLKNNRCNLNAFTCRASDKIRQMTQVVLVSYKVADWNCCSPVLYSFLLKSRSLLVK